MKDRAVWAFVVFALLVLGGIFLVRRKEAPLPPARAPLAVSPVVPAPAPVAVNPAPPPVAAPAVAPAVAPAGPVLRVGRNGAAVPIQDGKTIDMSSGRPVVRDDAHSRATIDKSVKEMEEAAKNVTFSSTPAAPTDAKNATPAPKP